MPEQATFLASRRLFRTYFVSHAKKRSGRGGETRQPEIRLRSQATAFPPCPACPTGADGLVRARLKEISVVINSQVHTRLPTGATSF